MTGSSLTQRAHGDVDRRPEGPTLRQQIIEMEHQFAMAMPKGMEAAQLVRDALTCLQQVPKLAECSPRTVLGALMTCAQLGLRPGVLGHAWVLPYWDSKTRSNVAQLIVGYKGYVELAYRTPQIASIIARTVYDGDTLDVEYGLEDKLIHRPAMSSGGEDRRTPTAHYCVVKFVNGGRVFWVMTEDETQAWKKRYAPKNKQGNIVGPWVSDYEAMARKTTLLRLAAWIPKSTDLAYAMEIDGGVRVDVSPAANLPTATHHYQQDDETPDPSGDAGKGDPEPGAEQAESEASSPVSEEAASLPTDEPPGFDGGSSAADEGSPETGPAASGEPAQERVGESGEDPGPRMSIAAQKRAIGAMFTKLGFKGEPDRPARLAAVSTLVGRVVESTDELTYDEATDLMGSLAGCNEHREKLDELLTGIRDAEAQADREGE